MQRKVFLKSFIAALVVPSAIVNGINIRYPYKSVIGWEVFGGEEINSKGENDYTFNNYLLESFNVQPNEYQINFESGRICDFDCIQEYKETRDFKRIIFYMEFDIHFTHSGYKKFKLQS